VSAIRWSKQAAGELDAALDFLLERNPDAASDLAARILDVVDAVASGRFAGPAVTLLTGERVQSWPVPPLRLFTNGKARSS
jgi:plasmid stabilization system protein ParE